MTLLFSGNMQQTIYTLVIRLMVALVALPIHEYAHAYAAYKMGDNTAARTGRLTLNPLAHLDPFGFVTMVFIGFGWAKPVQINPLNFENPKKGMMLSALAGPLSNIGLAFLSMALYKLTAIPMYLGITGAFLSTIQTFLWLMIAININLAVFNFIPIYPLDGSRIATYFLPRKIYTKIMQYQNIIFIVFVAALFLGILDVPMDFVSSAIIWVIDFITRPIDWFAAIFF